MKGVVTNRQIFFIQLFTLTSGSLISMPKDAIAAAGTGAWFTIMLLTFFFALGIYIITSLNKQFQGKTIFEYSTVLVGKPVAQALSLIYTGNFLLVLVLLFRIAAEFIKGSFLFLTPIWAILLLFVGTTVYIANKGITNIGRMCEIYGVIFIFASLSVHTAMFLLGDILQIQPFFEPEQIKQYVFGTRDLFVAFLGIEVLAIIPFGEVNQKKGVLYSVLSVVYVGLFYIFIVETSTMIVGINDILNYNNALIAALRETRLPSTVLLERVDLLFPTIGIFGIISGLCILIFTAVENASNIFLKQNKNMLFLVVGMIVYIISAFFLSTERAITLFNTAVPMLGIFTAFLIPFILFVLAKVRKNAN
jgi:spore germination protein